MEDDFIQDKKVSKDLFIKISIYFQLNFLHFQLTFEYISSSINEFIMSVFLFYFLQKDLTSTKMYKSAYSEQKLEKNV